MKERYRFLFFATVLVIIIGGCVRPGLDAPAAMKGGATMNKAMVILYVADQERSKAFYGEILGSDPLMNVPGMTEFPLSGSTSLGLMPESGTTSFLGDKLPAPSTGSGIPRCELYLFVESPGQSYDRLVKAGGVPVSPPEQRPWGDTVAYGADPDGHVIAFAKRPVE